MAKREDAVYTSYYSPFAGNPVRGRKALMQRMYLRILTEYAANRFTWTGLPDTIDLRFLELTLFNQSLCVFYYDSEYDRYMALRASGTGAINMYDNPTTFTVTGNTMINKVLPAADCVPIWSNYLRIPDLDIVSIYSGKLAEIDRTIEVNIIQQRRPFIITAPESQRQTALNALKSQVDGEIAVFGTDQFDANSVFGLLPTSIDKELVLNGLITKNKIWNECMTLLGINNANQDKKERLVSDEVMANDGQVLASRGVQLNARRHAVEQINKRFNLEASVEWNIDSHPIPPRAVTIEDMTETNPMDAMSKGDV